MTRIEYFYRKSTYYLYGTTKHWHFIHFEGLHWNKNQKIRWRSKNILKTAKLIWIHENKPPTWVNISHPPRCFNIFSRNIGEPRLSTKFCRQLFCLLRRTKASQHNVANKSGQRKFKKAIVDSHKQIKSSFEWMQIIITKRVTFFDLGHKNSIKLTKRYHQPVRDWKETIWM